MQIAGKSKLFIAINTALIATVFFAIADARVRAQSPALTANAQPIQAAGDPHRIDLDVRVTDKAGNAIEGLTAQDFTLLDNKKPAKIDDFREVDASNSSADPLTVVIVIDTINTDFDVAAREREQLGEYLKQNGGRLAHPTSIAVIAEKGIQIEKARTEDGNALFASLSGANSGLRMEGRSSGFYGATDRLQWSLAELSELAAYEATQPGRKLALFISPGWPLLSWAGVDATSKERDWTFNGIVNLTNGLRRARVTLYALDPFSFGRTNPFYYQTFLKGVAKPGDSQYGDLGLEVLAEHTGGLVETSGRDIKGEINDALRDAGSFYVMSLEEPPADRTNEYHDLHVQVDKPGAKARTTSGYYANPAPVAGH
jgi:VWFA-related protein